MYIELVKHESNRDLQLLSFVTKIYAVIWFR